MPQIGDRVTIGKYGYEWLVTGFSLSGPLSDAPGKKVTLTRFDERPWETVGDRIGSGKGGARIKTRVAAGILWAVEQ